MKHLRKFDSVSEMNTALASATINILALAYDGQGNPVLKTKQAPDPSIPFYIDVRGSVTLAATSGLQMSTDKTNWTDTTATTLSTGKTYFRVATNKGWLLQPNWNENNSSDYDIGGNINSLASIDFKNDTNGYSSYGFFQYKTKLKSAGDLILPGIRLEDECYKEMFSGCTSLTTAPALPATTLANDCYAGMFYGCSSLTTAPTLPATTLASGCYGDMFVGCTSLTTAPVLPATTLVGGCYFDMFKDCTSLTTAPALPATTLAQSCYNSLFDGCTALTTAPALPATTLAQSCYENMFINCTSLVTAPELQAITLAPYCYKNMFNGCTNLNYIKCLATDISASYCLITWVDGVASTGTFIKAASMSDWTTGNSGIPSGWTVQDA